MLDALRPSESDCMDEWRRRVHAHQQAASRIGHERGREDTWGSAVDAFTADPRRTDEPALDTLRSLVRPGETWLDIGAGAGRYTLPLALAGATVIAVEPSRSMARALEAGASEHEISNVRLIEADWPMADPPGVDVAFIAHVGYGSEEIVPFLEAMEASARRLCVAMMLAQAPSSAADSYWLPVHGVERASLPAMPEFLMLQLARRRVFEVRLVPRYQDARAVAEGDIRFLRRHLRVEAGTEEDGRLLAEHARRQTQGEALRPRDEPIGIVTWKPGAS